MLYRFKTALCLFGILCGCVGLAQTYKCDWNVVGSGGGGMAGPYICGATVGQTAAGQLTGPNYWALIGFWQPEGATGVREQAYSPGLGPLVTRLFAPQPNPFRNALALRYSLTTTTHASLSIHDLAGRRVRTLVNAQQKPGRYDVRWDGRDQAGRSLANGVYFVRFVAGSYRSTEKLVLQK